MNKIKLLNKLGFLKPIQDEVELFWMLPEFLEKKRILEIGTAGGGSLARISEYATEDAILYSIDIKQKWYVRFLLQWVTKKKQRTRLIQADSKKVLPYFFRCFDVIFIDGSHTYEDVKTDFMLSLYLLNKGGKIILHDILNKGKTKMGTYYEVWKLWKEIKKENRRYKTREYGQTGIVEVLK